LADGSRRKSIWAAGSGPSPSVKMSESKERSKSDPKKQTDDQSRLVNVRSWAVGRLESPLRVAIRLNDHQPFVFEAGEARALAEALQSECQRIGQLEGKPRKR
jgi:hypothetical protein